MGLSFILNEFSLARERNPKQKRYEFTPTTLLFPSYGQEIRQPNQTSMGSRINAQLLGEEAYSTATASEEWIAMNDTYQLDN